MKTQIRRLDSLTHNDTAATKLINDNFSALQQGIEDALSRSGKAPNFMDAEFDMNMKRIINIGDPVDDYDIANKHYVDITVAAEETRARAAEEAITDTLDTYGNIVTHNVSEFATAAQGAKADTALQPADLGDGTITINQDGTTVGTFTTNQSGDTTINLTNTPANKYATVLVSFPIGTTMIETDVSSIVEDGVLYTPYVFIDAQYTETINTNPSYNKSTKKLRIYRQEATSALSFTAYVTFVASDNQNATSAVGISTGQDCAGFNRSYSKSEEDALLAAKQDEIDSSHKLSADLVDDSTSTNKFVTDSDKTTWNGKQDEIDSSHKLDADLVDDSTSTNKFVTASDKTTWSGKQDEIDSSHKLSADLVDDTSTTNKFVTSSDKTTWNGKQDALVSGTNIKTINNTSILGSGDITISSGSDIVYKDYTISWTADEAYVDIDVSNEVENLILYVPMARVYSSNVQYIDTKIRYDKNSKKVRVYRNKNYYPDASNNDIAYITLIPTTSTDTQAWGVASGLASSQLVSNLVTSVDSSSTNSQYPSAKLFYDTCGDIETLINAL